MMNWIKRAGRDFCAICTAILLSCMCPCMAASAWADDKAEKEAAQKAVDNAQSALDGAENRMESISGEYSQLQKEADALQKKIDKTSKQALEAQEAVIEGREALGRSAACEYRGGGSTIPLIQLVLDSDNFSELTRNLSYLSEIMDYQTEQIAAQQKRSENFEKLVSDLNSQKDKHDAKLEELESKREEAQQVLNNASSELQDAKNSQAKRLAELKKKAEAMDASGGTKEPVKVDEATTTERQDAISSNTPVEKNPDASAPGGSNSGASSGGFSSSNGSSGSNQNSSSGNNNVGWKTGVASAYGGSTDPYTPNPGITATGAVCNDSSMGVAIPMSWPKYWRYYGCTVEISYGGRTVLATVNDCGYMGGGSRSLDLQPGVWKAFGFKSCQAWGLRTVSYRFL